MSQHYRNMVSAVLCAMLITTGTVVPFIQPATAQSDTPSPAIEDVDIPDKVTVGESFEVDVEGENNGGRAGAYSTITISSPDLDRPGDDSQIEITDDFDHSYSVKNGEGDQLYDADGDSMSAEYAMAEAGTTVDDYWEAGTSRSFAAEITPEESGTLDIYVRVTLTDDDSSEKYTAPSFGEEDQQDYTVEHYEVEVKEEAEIDATIEDVDSPSGEFTTGEEVTSEVTVENTGNRDHEFYVGYSVRGPDDEWRDNDASTHEPIYLGPGDDGEVDVEWDVEDDAPTGEYDIWATVYKDEDDGYLEDRLAETQRTDVFEVTTENSAPSIDTEDPYSDPTIAPGEEVKFEIEADDQDGNLNGVDWYVDGDYTGDSDQLSGNSDSAAWEHSFDSPGTYTVEAQAHDTQEEYSNPVSWTVTVEEPEQIDADIVGIDEPGGEYTTGETVETGVTIENTGNTGHEFYVGYSVRGPDDEWRDNDASTHEPIYLGPEDDGEVDVEWEYEDDAPTGEYDIWLTVYKTEDDGYLEDQLAETQRTDVFEVTIDNSPPTIEAEDPYSGPTVTPEEKVEFEIEADDQNGNLNGVDWIVDGDYTGDSDQLSGNSDSAAWEHSFDSPGTYTVEAQAHDTREEYSNRVSWTVTVEEPEQIDADIVSVATPTGEYNVGDTVEATVTVENTGNTGHEFYVGYSVRGSDGEWRDNSATTHESATVDAGDQTTVDVEWEVEETAPIGTYEIWTTVYRDLNNGKLENKLSGRQHSDVFEVAAENTPPTIEAEEPNTDITIKSEEALTFTTEAEDSNDNLAGVEWYVDGEYTGDTSQLEGDSGTGTWEHTFDEAGTYTVAAEAFDQAEAYSETITWSVTVSDIDATIQSVDPPSAELTSSEVAETEITIENTGDTSHEFYVGYSVRGPDGEWRDNDGSTHESVFINPSETATVEVEWEIKEDTPTGDYDIWTTVYKDESNGKLQDKLSEQQQSDSFTVTIDNQPPILEREDSTSTKLIEVNSTATFDIEAGDPNGNLDGVEWHIDDEFTGHTSDLQSGSSDSIQWQRDFDSPGVYDVDAIAFDKEDARSEEISWTVSVEKPQEINASVAEFEWPAATYSAGDDFTSEVGIHNTGTVNQQFTIDFEIRRDGGSWMPVQSQPPQTESIAPGNTNTRRVNVDLPTNAEPGVYDGKVVVSKIESDTTLTDRSTEAAFEIVPEEDLINISSVELPEGPNQTGQEYQIEQAIQSTDTEKRLLRVEYDIEHSEGEWRNVKKEEFVLDPETDIDLEQSFSIPEDLSEGSHDLRILLYGADNQNYLYHKEVVSDAITVESQNRLVVTARDQGGNPLSTASVSVSDDSVGPRSTGEDGAVEFENIEGELSITTTPLLLDYQPQTKIVQYDGDSTKRVDFVFGKKSDVSGTVTLSSGTPVRNVNVEIDGQSATTDEDGEFEYNQSLAPGHTTALIKTERGIIGRIPVDISDSETRLDIEIPDTSPSQSQSSFARGAVCGLDCWPHDVEDKSQYMLGWVASGFIVAGDVRDLVVAIDTNQGDEALLATFGLIPLYGDTAKSLKHIEKLKDSASLTERLEAQRTLGKIDQFDDERFKIANRLYDGNPGTYLRVKVGTSEDAMETYLKNGRNIKQLADSSEELIDKYGFTKQSVRNLIDSKVNMEEVVEVARRTGINDASKYIRMIDSPTEAKYVVGKPNFAGLTKAGDIGELKASRELAKSTGGKITQLKNIHKLDDGTYVLHSSSPDVVDAGDIDAMVVKKSGDTVEIQRVVEVYSGGNAGKAIGKKSQINKIRADLTKNPEQIVENSDISVSFADDLRQEIYLASETAAKTDSGAGTTVQKSIESSGEYTVKKFNIE